MRWLAGIFAFLGLASPPHHAPAPVPPKAFVVAQSTVGDEKSVFATVEANHVVPARTRIGGTILTLSVRPGDRVARGQVIATIGDDKLVIQVGAFGAQVKAAQAQLAQAKLEYDRAQHLAGTGILSKNQFDQQRTAYDVALNNLMAVEAQRAAAEQQVTEGKVLAPLAGRIVTVPVTTGTVVMPGEAVATLAEGNFVLRLEVPERHLRFMKAGDRVRVDGNDLGLDGPRYGTITLVYPQIADGRLEADASVQDLPDYFVGQRVRVWVPAGERRTVIVPASLITTRFGMDYARVWTAADGVMDVPVQRGQPHPLPRMPDGLEILSGLQPGDRLLRP